MRWEQGFTCPRPRTLANADTRLPWAARQEVARVQRMQLHTLTNGCALQKPLQVAAGHSCAALKNSRGAPDIAARDERVVGKAPAQTLSTPSRPNQPKCKSWRKLQLNRDPHAFFIYACRHVLADAEGGVGIARGAHSACRREEERRMLRGDLSPDPGGEQRRPPGS